MFSSVMHFQRKGCCPQEKSGERRESRVERFVAEVELR
jgi:hypothetical protein